MKRIEYFYKNSNKVAYSKVILESGYSYEYTYDELGNKLTYKISNGVFKIRGKNVTKEEYDNFLNLQKRPMIGKKVWIDGIEYKLK